MKARHAFRRVVVDGEILELHWAELGLPSGRPLVLVHGISDAHTTWSRAAPLFAARGRRVLALDLPGHGLSSRPDASYALDWYARVVAAWLDALDLSDVDVVGHSFGGGVAQAMLLHARARVRKVALVAPGGMGREVMLPLRLSSLTRTVETIGQPWMTRGTAVLGRAIGRDAFDRREIRDLAWMNGRPGSARALSRTIRDVLDWRGQARHFLDRAHEVSELPPLAVYWGARDPIVPARHAKTVLDHLENAQLTSFPTCGHFPHREEPARFVDEVHAFLSDDARPPAVLRRTSLVHVGGSRWMRRAAPVVGWLVARARERASAKAKASRRGAPSHRLG